MPYTALGGSAGTVTVGDVSLGLFPQALHPNVMAYVAGQSSIGYAMSINEIDAVNNLVWGMVGSGLWDKMQVVYPCIGNSAIGANSFKWNLKDITTFNLTFAGSWTFAATGMQVAAANVANRAATGYNPSINQVLNDAHLSVYVRNFYTAALTGSIFGMYNQFGGGGIVTGASNGLAGSADAWCINTGSGSGRVSLAGYSGGMLIVSRLTASSYAAHTLNGGVRSTSLVVSSGTRVNGVVNIGSTQTTGGFQACQPQEIAFASLGLGLTRNDHKTMYDIVQAFQTKLGRQV